MKTLIGRLLLLFAFIVQFGCAQSQGSSLLLAVEKLPPCAIRCLTTAIAASPCELTDQTCVCSNAKLNADVEACVLQSCTIKQGLTTKNVTQSTCGAPVRDRSNTLRITNITLGVISAACVLIRIVYKIFVTVSELGWDDYFIAIALVSGLPSTIIIDRGLVPNGMGRDIWSLEYERVTKFILFLYVMEILYFLQVSLLKLSLLFFYHRIFPGKPVRNVIMATVIFNVLFCTVFIFVAIFQCQPVSLYWTRWDGEHAGKCININALAWSNAAISISLDFWMLAIPLSQLINLKLAWKKKVGVAMMFCVGTFVTIVSILRLQSLVHFANSINPTWDQLDIIVWSDIEINVGIICVCMPAIRVLLVRFFPKLLGTTRHTTNQYYENYGSRSGPMGRSRSRSHGMPSQNAKDKFVVTYSKTFEVQHGDKDNDEIGLVEMDKLSGSGPDKVKSGNSSEISL